jgi:hypothetical protein
MRKPAGDCGGINTLDTFRHGPLRRALVTAQLIVNSGLSALTGIKMRLSTLRTLLLVLAMVMQTFAGGAGLARAASLSSEQALSAQCHELRADAQSAPNDKLGHRRHCQSCLLCGGAPPAAWVSLLPDYVFAPGEFELIDAPSYAAPPLFQRSSRAHSARAPPFSRI